MNPSPGMGYAKRKPLTGNPYEWFDEEAEAVRPLLYSTLVPLFYRSVRKADELSDALESRVYHLKRRYY
jgi:hypothetical protein